jgi:superfamily II DNA or RNA helicase
LEKRWYQQKAEDEVALALKEHTGVICCMPTGTGKTLVLVNVIKRILNRGKSVMVLLNRIELIDQATKTLKRHGLSGCMILPDREIYTTNLYVASVQTLNNRANKPLVDFICVDECHIEIFDRTLLEYPSVKKIGFTATPMRMKNTSPLGGFYTHIVEPITITESIKQGFLMPAYYCGAKESMANVKLGSDGDYDESEMYAVFDKPKLYKDVVDKYTRFTPNQKAIVFCINVEHGEKTAKEFTDSGYPAVFLDGTTPKKIRKDALGKFESGEIKVLVNVGLYIYGLDVTSITVVIVDLMTKSIPKWLQMLGRASRPHEGKDRFTAIDMGGNLSRLGLWEMERTWDLFPQKKKKGKTDVFPIKQCDESTKDINGKQGCGYLVPIQTKVCPNCGKLFPVKESASETIEAEFELVSGSEITPKLTFKQEIGQIRRLSMVKRGDKWVLDEAIARSELIKFARSRNYAETWVWKQIAIWKSQTRNR